MTHLPIHRHHRERAAGFPGAVTEPTHTQTLGLSPTPGEAVWWLSCDVLLLRGSEDSWLASVLRAGFTSCPPQTGCNMFARCHFCLEPVASLSFSMKQLCALIYPFKELAVKPNDFIFCVLYFRLRAS